jgi:glycosyltransferase involved in cell wall biosynthesis
LKVSLIATVFNESKTIDVFVNALLAQTRKADEIIVIDGGSTDSTVSKLKGYSNIKVSVAKGNRSVGRNQAISLATGNVIAITDAGCVADPTWLEELLKPFNQKSTDVVAGYYQSKAQTIYQKCLTPYALVMPDKVDSQTFLPATRSMAIKKSVWEAVGGFNEKFSHNEDYVFAREIKKLGTHIVFAKDAVVYWIPRNSIKESYTMFYRFSFGDIEAGILRPKVIVLF